MAQALYLDASALVKLVVVEPESEALVTELARWPHLVSSVIVDVELHRAAMRAGQPAERAADVLERMPLLTLNVRRRELARRVGSRQLRSLDAIHLASALSLGDDLGAFCCYDRRLAADAQAAGLTVLSPGLD